MSFIVIYVTHKNKKEANKIINHLLKKKLIACANTFPSKSAYLWKGKKESSNEIISLLKTKSSHWNKVKNEIKKIHPYEVPCIIKLNVQANKEYEAWINSEPNETKRS